MAKMNVQFHATIEDIYDFILDMLDRKYFIKGSILFPSFIMHDIHDDINILDFKKYNCFYVSKTRIEDVGDYKEFSLKQINMIGIDMGTQKTTESSMTEMIMWTGAEDEIDSDFKKVINRFKRTMHRGAWGMTPGHEKEKYFYKNHLYTDRARKAYEQGVKLYAYGGFVFFELPDVLN